MIFNACALAYRASWRSKGPGIALGISLIFAFNGTRALLLLIVGRYEPETFELFHLYFRQASLITRIATLWLGWLRYGVRR